MRLYDRLKLKKSQNKFIDIINISLMLIVMNTAITTQMTRTELQHFVNELKFS